MNGDPRGTATSSVSQGSRAARSRLQQTIRIVLTLGAFFIFCSYIPSFLFLLGHTSVNPGAIVVLFFGVSVLLWLLFDQTFPGRVSATFAWALLFVALNLAALAIHGPGDEMYQRVAGALSIICLVWFCLTPAVSSTQLHWFLFAFSLFNLSCVAYDFFFPGLFVPSDSEFYNAGRGAGFFVNANKAGFAAVFVLVFSAFAARSRIMIATLTLCTAWVLFTLSRSAILAFLVVLAILISTGKLRLRDLLLPAALGVALTATGVVYLLAIQPEGIGNIEERIEWATAPTQIRDQAGEERKVVASNALRALTDSPLVGNGFGTPLKLFGRPPHNLYLGFAADYGVLGLVALIGLYLAMYIDWRHAGAPESLRAPLYSWLAATAFLSLFYDETIGITEFVFSAAWFQLQVVQTRHAVGQDVRSSNCLGDRRDDQDLSTGDAT